jgi:hypothetical protein
MEFGIQIKTQGYNIYIAGISGSGKTTYAREYISKIARDMPVPDDWCYVYNFENPESTCGNKASQRKGQGILPRHGRAYRGSKK